MTAPTLDRPILSDALLTTFNQRAAGYDQANTFFHEDFEDLRAADYLRYCIPTEFGGHGASLADYIQVLRKLAYHAPATALATNMHQY